MPVKSEAAANDRRALESDLERTKGIFKERAQNLPARAEDESISSARVNSLRSPLFELFQVTESNRISQGASHISTLDLQPEGRNDPTANLNARAPRENEHPMAFDSFTRSLVICRSQTRRLINSSCSPLLNEITYSWLSYKCPREIAFVKKETSYV